VPLYRFDWALGEHHIRDTEGLELPDDDAAREHAATEIRELLGTIMGKRLGKDCMIEVCDANGRVLFSVNCAEI
jgi:hypothetical protein